MKTTNIMAQAPQARSTAVHVLLATLLLQGLSGTAGGIGLIADPTGSALGIPHEWLQGSPFSSYLVPGIVLLLVLGFFPLIVARAVFFRRPWSWHASLFVSLALIIWIVVEILIIGYQPRPALQLIYGLLGVAMLALVLLPTVRHHLLGSKAGA